MSSEHERWMKVALSLAKRGLGNVAPNPAVGCLLVRDDVVVGRGWTQPSGRPHAETVALEQAGSAAKGATAYVTLEPCAHHGKTPPCAEALINAGVGNVVVAVSDPDDRVSGKGIAMLRRAGVNVETGVLEAEAFTLNAGFFHKVSDSRPFYTLKSAASIDGKIATTSGDSKWITGPEARMFGHMQRAKHDAILVGVNTVLADNPALDCRIPGLENCSPRPIVLDSSLKTPPKSRFLLGPQQDAPIIICDENQIVDSNAKALQKAGAELLALPNTRDVGAISRKLAERGITRVLVEGGGQVLASFLGAGHCDQLLAFSGRKVIGAEGISSVGALGLARLVDAPHLTLKEVRRLGADLLATYVNAE